MAKSPEKEMPFLDHLEELRSRLFWVIGAVVVGLIVGFGVVFSLPQVLDFILAPIIPYLPPPPDGSPAQLITTTPAGAFKFKMAIALYMALIMALPVILYQVWAFLSPGLYKHERKLMLPVLGAGTFLFLLGVTVAFKLALPLTLRFLIKIAEQNFALYITVESYFDLMLGICLAFGVMFELPIVVLALTWLGIVTPQLLSRTRRYAIVILLATCAIFTPPEISSLLIMFVPVYALYEVSIALSYILYRRRQNKAAADDLAAQT